MKNIIFNHTLRDGYKEFQSTAQRQQNGKEEILVIWEIEQGDQHMLVSIIAEDKKDSGIINYLE
jgi:hypothetical protein